MSRSPASPLRSTKPTKMARVSKDSTQQGSSTQKDSTPNGNTTPNDSATMSLDGLWFKRIHDTKLGSFLPSDIIMEHPSVRDWSVHPDWQVTQQDLPGSSRLGGAVSGSAASRLIFPRWITWHGRTYLYDEKRSVAPVSEEDELNIRSLASGAKKKRTSRANKQLKISGAWGVMVFYTLFDDLDNRSEPKLQSEPDRIAPKTLGLKICHRQARQVVETSVQSMLHHLLSDPQLKTYADSFMIPLAVQYGDALINTADIKKPRFSLFPTFLIDIKTLRPKRRPVAFILSEAMDMDLFSSCTLSHETLMQAFGEHSPLLASRMSNLRQWKRAMFRSLVKPLHFMHRRGLVHADVKLENVLIQADPTGQRAPRIKLCDFDTTVRIGFSNKFQDCLGTGICYSPERWSDYQVLVDLREHHRRIANEYARAMKHSQSIMPAALLTVLSEQCKEAQLRVEAQLQRFYLPWTVGDDIWSLALVLLTMLTEQVWDSTMLQVHRKDATYIRNVVLYRLTETRDRWLSAFEGQTVESMCDVMCCMLHMDPTQRVLLPPFERKALVVQSPTTIKQSQQSQSPRSVVTIQQTTSRHVVDTKTDNQSALTSCSRSLHQHAPKPSIVNEVSQEPRPSQNQDMSSEYDNDSEDDESDNDNSSQDDANVSLSQSSRRGGICHSVREDESRKLLSALGTHPTAQQPDDAQRIHTDLLDVSTQAANIKHDGLFDE